MPTEKQKDALWKAAEKLSLEELEVWAETMLEHWQKDYIWGIMEVLEEAEK